MHHSFCGLSPLTDLNVETRTIPLWRLFFPRSFTFCKSRKPTRMVGETLLCILQMSMATSGLLKGPGVHTEFMHGKLMHGKCLFMDKRLRVS